MEHLPKRQIATASYQWGKATNREKFRLWKANSDWRPLFVELPDDCFFLFEGLDASFWPELVRLNYSILDRGPERAQLLTNILHMLPSEAAVKAFSHIQQYTTRTAIMAALSPVSKDQVDAALTRASMEVMQKMRDDPQEKNYLMATDRFLAALDDSLQRCSSKRCMGDNTKPHQEYMVFSMAPCLSHSFHLTCEQDHDCGADSLVRKRKRVYDDEMATGSKRVQLENGWEL